MLSFKYIPDTIFIAAHTSPCQLMSVCLKEGSADGTAALTTRLGSLKANMSLRDKEGSANRTVDLTARL